MRTTQKNLTEPGKATKRNNLVAPVLDLFPEVLDEGGSWSPIFSN